MHVTTNPTTKVRQERRQEQSRLLKRWLRVLGGVIARQRLSVVRPCRNWAWFEEQQMRETAGCDCEMWAIER